MNLKVFYLSTGETLVADFIRDEGSSIRIRGLSVAPVEREQGVAVTLVPFGGIFGMSVQSGEFDLQKTAIVATAEADKQMEQIFIQATTGITLAHA